MTEQTSRLSIVIDTGNAQNAIKNLTNSLKNLETVVNSAMQSLTRLGAISPL